MGGSPWANVAVWSAGLLGGGSLKVMNQESELSFLPALVDLAPHSWQLFCINTILQ